MVMGEQVITAQPLPLSSSRSGPYLVIVELMPTPVVLAPVTDLRLYLLILLVGGGAVAVVGAVLIGGKLTRPIVALEKAPIRSSRVICKSAYKPVGPTRSWSWATRSMPWRKV